jgi:ankyrin repeat protein
MNTRPWFDAAEAGDARKLQSMLSRGAAVNAADEKGQTALLKAVDAESLKAVRALLEAGADPNRADARHRTPLGQAAWLGLETIAVLLLAKGASPEGYGHGAVTPLMAAVSAGRRAIAELLLGAGADPKAATTEGGTALHRAAGIGRTKLAQLLIERGAAVNAATDDGTTALHLAARQTKMGTARLLLARGADVNARTRDGRTPVLEAVLHGRARIVQVFLDAKADPNVPFQGRDDFRAELERGATCLMIAAHQGALEIVEALLAAGADPMARNDRGRTALEVAEKEGHGPVIDRLRRCTKLEQRPDPALLGPRLVRAAAAGSADEVRALLAQGADSNSRDPKPAAQGRTALIAAAAEGHVEAVRALLAAGADMELATVENEWLGPTTTALMAAAREGRAGVVTALIEAGAGVNRTNDRGESALFVACGCGHAEIVRLLLEAEADAALGPHTRDEEEVDTEETARDALENAIVHDRAGVVDVLLARGVRPSADCLIAAARLCRAELVRRLLAAGVDVNARGRDGRTALHAACSPETTVVEHQPEVNILEVEDSKTYLARAAAWQRECVSLLLEAGANVHVRDERGRTPLHEAAAMNTIVTYVHAKDPDGNKLHTHNEIDTCAVVRMLLAHGCEVNAQDVEGFTPLWLASRVNAQWCADPGNLLRALVGAGAEVNRANHAGKTPLFADYETGAKTIEFLLSAGADVNHRDLEGRTPLFDAVERAGDRPQIARALIAAGADVNARDPGGRTVMDLAGKPHDRRLARLLKSAGARRHVTQDHGLRRAIESGDEVRVRAALQAGADPHVPLDVGDAFALAVSRGKPVVVSTLIEAGADVKRDYPAPCVGPPLFIALEEARTHPPDERSTELFQLLLAKGADPNARTRKGWSALTYASWMHERALVDILKRYGASLEGDTLGRDFEAVLRFASAANTPGHIQAVSIVGAEAGAEAQPIKWLPGAVAFFVTVAAETEEAMRAGDHPPTARFAVEWQVLNDKVLGLVRALRPRLVPLGASVLDMGRPIGCGPSGKFLVFLPTTDPFVMLAACGPSPGGDYGTDGGLFLPDVVAWFHELAEEYRFTILGAGRDFVDIEFLEEIGEDDARRIAEKTYEFCPDTVDQGAGSKAKLARQIKEQRRIYYWWD